MGDRDSIPSRNRNFSRHHVQTGSGAHRASCARDSRWSLKLTTNIQLGPRLIMRWALPPLHRCLHCTALTLYLQLLPRNTICPRLIHRSASEVSCTHYLQETYIFIACHVVICSSRWFNGVPLLSLSSEKVQFKVKHYFTLPKLF